MYYEILEDGTIGKSTPDSVIAKEVGLNLQTEREIVYVNGKGYFADDEEYLKIKEQQELERIKILSLTAADVERAIYKAKGIDFEDILELVKDNPEIDSKALKIELKANNFYRGNPYIETVGALLGFTPQMLDEFFETNDYTKLVVPPDTDTPEEEEEVENEETV